MLKTVGQRAFKANFYVRADVSMNTVVNKHGIHEKMCTALPSAQQEKKRHRRRKRGGDVKFHKYTDVQSRTFEYFSLDQIW